MKQVLLPNTKKAIQVSRSNGMLDGTGPMAISPQGGNDLPWYAVLMGSVVGTVMNKYLDFKNPSPLR